eukprot:TRINITY_DN11140_c0_g1_i1.p1 TRINITY_DN11140_c0_g1~~TRINITY_DN11140_c0_g1_i1.p1  ORF type:complete len:312 (-),score=86.21 TRINITY_DN11140_c0_g1_i1:18-833(-)
MEECSTSVTIALKQLEIALKNLPNAQDINIQTQENLEDLAARELLEAARIIRESVEALKNAKPQRKKPKIVGVLDEFDIQEAIVNAARAIAMATGKLVDAAATAQQERVETFKNAADTPGRRYKNDPTWANGLISAAQSVAGSVKALVTASNAAVTGKIDEAKLVATAKAVGAATAQLVYASKVKADVNSQSQVNLNAAAKEVAKATGDLVTAASTAGSLGEADELEDSELVNFSTTARIEQHTQILRLEKQLEDARKRYNKINQMSYKNM